MYKVKLHAANSTVRFDNPTSMLRYIHSLNEKGIKYSLQFDRDGNESENVPAAPLRQPDGMR